MIKVCVLVWDVAALDRATRRARLVGDVGGALLALDGVGTLWIDVADEEADVPSPTPFPLGVPRVTGLVNVRVTGLDVVPHVVAAVEAGGFRVAAYQVEESVYRDDGDNAHAGPRDWPDGARSPGVVTVNLLERPRRLDRATWVHRWHTVMSPVSEAIQPRARYVRNLVIAPLTPGAPPYEGIVEECWRDAAVLADPWRFYGASGPIALGVNVLRILRAVTSFLTLWRVMTVPMGEHYLRTGTTGGASIRGPS